MGPGRLSRALLLHCRRALGAARCPLKPPYGRSLGAAAAFRLCAPQRPPDGRAGGRGRWKGAAGAGRDDDNNDDDEDEEEEEEGDEDEEDDAELEELLGPSPLGPQFGAHRVAVVHPAVRWGPKKPLLTTAELQMAEAVALVDTLQNWTVLDKIIIPTKNPDKKFIFGKGNFEALTERIKKLPHVTAVFLNVERISSVTKKELEDAWGVKVFDRYTVVLHIFRCNARTKEAKLQIALAEIPLLRSNLKTEVSHLDQQRGGSRYIMGSGETFMETQNRLLREKELKIRNALEKLRKKRSLLRTQRRKREFPIISVMGYTNCGKTTLIKALTGDAGIQPRDQLFATLDITAHAGYLPSHMAVIYVDTIGFLSELPHNLVESFSATLEEVAYSDLIVHVRDITHPETILQKASVLSVLKDLNLPSHLLESMVEVHNKVDLIESYQPTEENALAISALHGHGLEELKEEIEKKILEATGKKMLTITVNLQGPQLSWLYKESTVQEVDVMPDDGTARVKVIISNSAFGKYRNLFPNSKFFVS
ncbi:putative GTP-binding protein 6 [Gallus gallus]|uniref:Putative GTP-binding protein 6 n=1 Tax=Gallus gallus TaxID=9031 RepID=A0A8V0XDH5_CHICK|nr:putative GTP-binding protein 6 [Gallus gallus]XP_416868.4 putative GTP-binding protein 6 [Gallus gallus]